MRVPTKSGMVYIVDDDASVRMSLEDLFSSLEIAAASFESVEEFLRCQRLECPSCLVLDVRMPGQDGLELQQALQKRPDLDIPIIFITGHGDIPMSVQAMKAGAVDFLTKPFREQDLLKAVRAGLTQDQIRRAQRFSDIELRQRLASLTPGERAVMRQVVKGRPNKAIAADLGLSEITIKVRRAHVMLKMVARTLPDLVRMADRLRIDHESSH